MNQTEQIYENLIEARNSDDFSLAHGMAVDYIQGNLDVQDQDIKRRTDDIEYIYALALKRL